MNAIDLLQSGKPHQALPLLIKAAKKNPSYQNLLQLASAQTGVAAFDSAKETLNRAISLQPHQPEAWNNLAQVATEEGKFSDACALFHRCLTEVEAMKLEMATPSVQKIILGFAMSLMRLGEFERAWPLWEYGRIGVSWHPLPTTPAWKGQEVDSLLVVCEGGYGDAFLFSRWLPLAAKRCKHLSLLTYPNLKDWCDWHSIGVTDDVVVPSESPQEAPELGRGVLTLASNVHTKYFDAVTSWMSLPSLLGMKSWEDIPPSPWPQRFHQPTYPAAPRIGFCWWAEENGSIRTCRRLDQYTANAVGDCLNDIGLVFSLVPPKSSLYRNNEPWKPKRVAQYDAVISSWAETTEFIRTLDFVVTVDTAVAHLAGIVGVPTLLLLPLRSDWKWGVRPKELEGRLESCRWYGPNVQYFRNPLPSWQGNKICEAIRSMAARSGGWYYPEAVEK